MTVGVGLVGIGSIALYHLGGLRAAGGAVVTAVASRSAERAVGFAQQHGIPDATGDWRTLLTRDDISALVVATPDDTHEEIAVAAARAGKAVLLQKPMAPTVAACRAILAAAREAGTVLEVSFMHRYFEEVVAVRDLLARGTTGPILSLHLRNATPGPDWAPWLYRRDRVGGGVIMQIGVHGIDLLQHIAGPIEAVCATIATLRTSRILRDGSKVWPDNEDTAHALYRLAGGAVASHEMSFNDTGATNRFALDIFCANVAFRLRGERGGLAVHDGGGWRDLDLPAAAPGARHHAEYLAVIAGTIPPTRTADAGMAAVAVAQSAYRSSDMHAWVRP